jgi:peptidoglycan/LPS O-acetylase OafA/YrhL
VDAGDVSVPDAPPVLSRRDLTPAALAVIAGIVTWELVRHFGHRREAWDDPMYWSFGYPLLLAASLLLGTMWRDRPWRWIAFMMGAQAIWSLLLSVAVSGVPSLLPLGLIMFVILGVPCLGAAYLGKWLGERFLA